MTEISRPKRVNIFLVIFLWAFTFGIYPAYWFNSRAPILNVLHPNQKSLMSASKAKAIFVVALCSFGYEFGLSFIGVELSLHGPHPLLAIVRFAFNISLLAAFITLAFEVCDILNENAEETEAEKFASKAIAFFLTVIYLQFKINKLFYKSLEDRA